MSGPQRRCWCGNTELEHFSPAYLRCSICHTLTLKQRPDINADQVTDEPADLYGKDYHLKHLPQKYGYPEFEVRARNDLPERCLYWLHTLLKYKLPPAKVLEIGSGHGGFVAILHWAGFEAIGLELSPWVADFARSHFSVPVLLGPIENQTLPENSIDVIALMDVLEHLTDPLVTFRHCLRLLKPDGILLIQTPSLPENKSYEEMLEGNHPFLKQLKEEEHIYLFSPRSIKEFFHHLGAEHLFFEPPIFSHYDMFAVVSQVSPVENPREKIEEALGATSGGRMIQALLDLRRSYQELELRLQASEADRKARLVVVERQAKEFGDRTAELEADRAARLEIMERQGREFAEKIAELDADRAARLEVIERQGREFGEKIAELKSSMSWKITTPLRWVLGKWNAIQGRASSKMAAEVADDKLSGYVYQPRKGDEDYEKGIESLSKEYEAVHEPIDRNLSQAVDSLRILILNGDLPVFPGWGGIEYLHTTQLAQLAQKVGLVSLVHTGEQQEKKQGLIDAGVTLYLWENPNLDLTQAVQHLRDSLIRRLGKSIYNFTRSLSGRPQDTLIQNFAFRNMAGPISRALSDDYWQALVVVQSNCAGWLDSLPCFPVSVLVMHDVRALVYERQARVAESSFKRLVCLAEGRIYRHFEGKYCQRYDLVVTVSSTDEAWVRQHYQPARLVSIPIPVDTDYFRPLSSEQDAPAQVLFTGMMNHPPNVDAACFFARQVFPRIQEVIPEAEFWIVGRDPSSEVEALGELPGVTVTGFVPDIRPYIARATVFVVPLRFGAGMRQKILEAWAMEKCVISTRIGAEGLDYQDGLNILIADDAQEMAEKSIQVIQNPCLRNKIRGEGRNLVTHRHDPEKLAQKYYQAIHSTLRENQQQQRRMNVVIDLRWMRPGVAGGIENLSRSFLNQLLELDGFNQYNVFVPTEVRYDFNVRSHPNFRITMADGPSHYWRQLLWQGSQYLHRSFKIDYWRSSEVETLRRSRALNAEVALSIPGYIHPDLYPLANVLVVPDIQHEYCPEFFSPHDLNERRKIYTGSIQRADHLCAISEFTRRTVIERLGIAPDRVTTTPLAADPLFHPESSYRGNHEEVLKKYDLRVGEYLFFPGHTWPHKNHQAAFRALAILRERDHLEPILVCTGNPKEAHSHLLNLIRDLRLDDRVRFLGYCPVSDMPAFYEGAAALVFPSLFEGFGMPLLEAMWCDCPIVCSNATSLPEVAGDAALYVDPHSPDELAVAMNRILTDHQLRQRLIALGRQQAKKFSWQKFTAETLGVLHDVWEKRWGKR